MENSMEVPQKIKNRTTAWSKQKKRSINRDPENLSSLHKIPQVEKEMREDSNDPIS